MLPSLLGCYLRTFKIQKNRRRKKTYNNYCNDRIYHISSHRKKCVIFCYHKASNIFFNNRKSDICDIYRTYNICCNDGPLSYLMQSQTSYYLNKTKNLVIFQHYLVQKYNWNLMHKPTENFTC